MNTYDAQKDHDRRVTQNNTRTKLQELDCETATSNPTDQQRLLSRNGFKQYWLADLRINTFVEAQLLLLTFAIGIQDAISYPDFRCFASNQTGNTVVLAVALAGQAGSLFDAANTGVSLGAFLAGAMSTGHLGSLIRKRRRVWQVAIALAQVLMIAGSAWIQYVHGTQQSGAWARGALALLAFASGSQVAAARAFKIPEITTAMAINRTRPAHQPPPRMRYPPSIQPRLGLGSVARPVVSAVSLQGMRQTRRENFRIMRGLLRACFEDEDAEVWEVLGEAGSDEAGCRAGADEEEVVGLVVGLFWHSW